MWYVFGYKLINNYVGFGVKIYDKVINKLNDLGIGYYTINNSDILLINYSNDEVYDLYIKLSHIALDKKNKELELINKIKLLDYNKYSIVMEFIDKLNV